MFEGMSVIDESGNFLGNVDEVLIRDDGSVVYLIRKGLRNESITFEPKDVVGAKDEVMIKNYKRQTRADLGKVTTMEDLDGKTVINKKGEDIGKVKTIANDSSGKALLVFREGGRSTYIPYSNVRVGKDRIVVDMDRIPSMDEQAKYIDYFSKIGMKNRLETTADILAFQRMRTKEEGKGKEKEERQPQPRQPSEMEDTREAEQRTLQTMQELHERIIDLEARIMEMDVSRRLKRLYSRIGEDETGISAAFGPARSRRSRMTESDGGSRKRGRTKKGARARSRAGRSR